jgi:hypothetical protein
MPMGSGSFLSQVVQTATASTPAVRNLIACRTTNASMIRVSRQVLGGQPRVAHINGMAVEGLRLDCILLPSSLLPKLQTS